MKQSMIVINFYTPANLPRCLKTSDEKWQWNPLRPSMITIRGADGSVCTTWTWCRASDLLRRERLLNQVPILLVVKTRQETLMIAVMALTVATGVYEARVAGRLHDRI